MEMTNLPYAEPAEAPRVLPRLLIRSAEAEPLNVRLLAGVLAVCLAVAYFAFVFQYWAPAHNGVDQNGYLVGGKMLAHTGSTGYKPADPLGFVGGMWVLNDKTGINYPKYPVGLPLIYAACFWFFGSHATFVAHLISPISAALAVAGTYLLARQFASIFPSLLAMLLMAFSQVTLVLADNPNSHASCTAFVVWGVFMLLRFWQTASPWRGLIAGFCLGYAATIRYTEGLLGLLIGFVIIAMISWRMWRDWRTLLRLATPLIGWLIPIGYLVIFNLLAMGTLTGYDTTNESGSHSFTWEHVTQNWEKLIRQVHDTGLFFTLPLGILGLALLWRSDAKRAALMWLWLIPGTLIYMAYYWAPERGVSYLRFFMTLLPCLCVGAAIAMDELRAAQQATRASRVFTPIALGLVVAVATSISLYRGLFGLEDGQETAQGLEGQLRINMNGAALDKVILANVPSGSVVFGNAGGAAGLMNDLQFAGNYECFNSEYFTANFVNRLAVMDQRADPEEPNPQQPARRKYLLGILADRQPDTTGPDGATVENYRSKPENVLGEMEAKIVADALAAGKRVFAIMPQAAANAFANRIELRKLGLTGKTVAAYDDLPRLRPPITEGTDPRAARPGGAPGGPGANRRGNAFGGRRGGPNFFAREPQPQNWRVVEIIKKPEKEAAAGRKR